MRLIQLSDFCPWSAAGAAALACGVEAVFNACAVGFEAVLVAAVLPYDEDLFWYEEEVFLYDPAVVEGVGFFAAAGATEGLFWGLTTGTGFFVADAVVDVFCGWTARGTGFLAVVAWGFAGAGTGFLVGRVDIFTRLCDTLGYDGRLDQMEGTRNIQESIFE